MMNSISILPVSLLPLPPSYLPTSLLPPSFLHPSASLSIRINQGCRKYTPCPIEIAASAEVAPVRIRVYVLDHTHVTVDVESWTTGRRVAVMAASKLVCLYCLYWFFLWMILQLPAVYRRLNWTTRRSIYLLTWYWFTHIIIILPFSSSFFPLSPFPLSPFTFFSSTFPPSFLIPHYSLLITH